MNTTTTTTTTRKAPAYTVRKALYDGHIAYAHLVENLFRNQPMEEEDKSAFRNAFSAMGIDVHTVSIIDLVFNLTLQGVARKKTVDGKVVVNVSGIATFKKAIAAASDFAQADIVTHIGKAPKAPKGKKVSDRAIIKQATDNGITTEKLSEIIQKILSGEIAA